MIRFPGLYRPGLIGAAPTRAGRHGRPQVSGALPPRPHWSRVTSAGVRPSALVSGALPPRPHWSGTGLVRVKSLKRRFPGLYRPGLIGAGPCSFCCRPSSRWFPGLYRPGLIGAWTPKRPPTTSPMVSGALPPRPHWSPCLPSRRRSLSPWFPGLYRPGLIGARQRRCWPSARLRFPGLYRPGLIGAPRRRGPADRRPWFPGLYRPGLIGAWTLSVGT